MKIEISRKAFWKAIALWAYRKWVSANGGEKPVGVPGNRDPENPCDSYMPMSKKRVGYRTGTCYSDGHYLCRGCVHLSIEETDAFPDLRESEIRQ